jgi:hypothetical protein
VAGDRRLRILAKLVGDAAPGLETARLCQVCAEVVGMTGAGISLMSGDVPQGSVCAANDVSAVFDRLQFDLGEGPSVDAHHLGRPIFEPDLLGTRAPRWFALTGPAVGAGVRAVFAFPLRVGAIRLGAMHLYRDRPGPLDDEQHADALVMADVAAEVVLLLQSEAPPGRLAAELEAGGEFPYVVHQASGMVAAQLDITVGQALIRLRAHAFGNDLPLGDVATDVVDRRLHFHADDDLEPT